MSYVPLRSVMKVFDIPESVTVQLHKLKDRLCGWMANGTDESPFDL
jgi:hypothetical protein